MSLFTMMTCTCSIHRPEIGRDSAMGVTQDFESLPAIIENEPCDVQPAGPSVQTLYSQRNVMVNAQIYFTRDVATTVNDIIRVYTNDVLVATFQVQGLATRLYNRFQAPFIADCLQVDKDR